MTVALGLLLGVGLLLIASPRLWPRDAGGRSARVMPGWSLLRDRLAQAGLPDVPPALFAALAAVLGVAAGAVAVALVPVLALDVGVAVLGVVAPFLVLGARARARRRAQRTVWPDVVDHLLSGIRSGVPLAECLAALADSGPPTLRSAFAAFRRDLATSGDLGVALDDLKARLADPVADRIVETLRMARDVGGTTLPGVLVALGGYLRRDAALRSELEGRQSWVVNAARLGVAAPWIVLLLLATRPEAAQAYNSPSGVAVLAIGLVVSVVAYRLMMALGRLPEERRWFA